MLTIHGQVSVLLAAAILLILVIAGFVGVIGGLLARHDGETRTSATLAGIKLAAAVLLGLATLLAARR